MNEAHEDHARQRITAHINDINRVLELDLVWSSRAELLAAKSQALTALALMDSRKAELKTKTEL